MIDAITMLEMESEAIGMDKGLTQGMAQGLTQGLTQGMAKSRREIALNLLNNDVDIQVVARSTGLALAELEQLRTRH